MTQFFRFLLPREKMSHFDLKNSITGRTKIWPKFLSQNDSIFCIVHWEKNKLFWPKKIETLAELKFDPNFWVKMTQFLAHCTERKNESFWPKKLSYWRKKSWPKFLGQNDSFFLSVHQEKRLSHFDLKIWVTGNNNSTNFHNRFYLVK